MGRAVEALRKPPSPTTANPTTTTEKVTPMKNPDEMSRAELEEELSSLLFTPLSAQMSYDRFKVLTDQKSARIAELSKALNALPKAESDG